MFNVVSGRNELKNNETIAYFILSVHFLCQSTVIHSLFQTVKLTLEILLRCHVMMTSIKWFASNGNLRIMTSPSWLQSLAENV